MRIPNLNEIHAPGPSDASRCKPATSGDSCEPDESARGAPAQAPSLLRRLDRARVEEGSVSTVERTAARAAQTLKKNSLGLGDADEMLGSVARKRCLPARVANSMAQQRLDSAAARRESGRARLDGLCAAPSSPAAPAARLGAEYWGGDRPRRGRGRDINRALRSCGIGGMVLGEARAGARQ